MPILRRLSFAVTALASVPWIGCSSAPGNPGSDAGASGQDAKGGGPSDAGRLDSPATLPSLDASDAAPVVDGAESSDAMASDGAVADSLDAGPESVLDADQAEEDAAPQDGRDAAPDADVGAPLTYVNPVIAQDFPDPFVLMQGSTYFAFATNAGSKNIQAASSTNLANWTVLADALPHLPAWAAKNAGLTWAPSIVQRGPSSFVMYYTAHDTVSNFQCISLAVATVPAGPYVDSSTAPFVCQVTSPQSLCGSIDPSSFVDTDGALYLIWKSDENASACSAPPRLWSAPLSADGLALTGPATQLLVMDQAWQQPIIEAPAMMDVAGRYYLLYSANQYESAAYAMGYATCLSPTGPCQNVSLSGPAISSAGSALGPGGGSFFVDAVGSPWLAYHAWTAPQTTYAGGGVRSLRIDPLTIGNGVLSLQGPTASPRSL